MNANIDLLAFEKQDGDIFRIQFRYAVANIHADSVEKMIAVRFDDQLTLGTGDPAKEASERRLGARMEMNFRLLQQENRRGAISQKFRYHGQNLTDSVTHVDQVSSRSLESVSRFSDLYLKRLAFHSAKSPHRNLVEQAGGFSEILKRTLEVGP